METPRSHDSHNSKSEVKDDGMSFTADNISVRGSKHADDVDGLEKATASPVFIDQAKDNGVDENIVDWDGPGDVLNPQNWSNWKKTVNITLISSMTFLTPLASSMFAPGVPEVMREFNSDSPIIATFVVSVYILGWVLGPLVIAPLSELYGRMPVYHVCNVAYVCFTIACALAANLDLLICFRFLQGLWSIAPLTIGPGSIADMVTIENRGTAMSLWALGPLMGPTVGPIAGGFLAEAEGWRWIFWVLAIAIGVNAILALIIMKESYPPVLLGKKAKRLRLETGNENLRSIMDTGLEPKHLFSRAISRPTKLLTLSPICFLMSLYIAIVYGCLYILFTTFTFVFQENYGFSESTVGLVYVGTGIGMFFGLMFLLWGSDRFAKRLALKNGSEIKPEYRLVPLMWTAPTLPIGLFIYGWTVQYKIHWAVPLLGTAFFGAGQVGNFMTINTYLVDAFTLYAASAVAASTVLRAIFGAVLPMTGLAMYDALGQGWGNSLLAFVLVVLCPIPYIFFVYGERLRTHPKFQIKF